MRSLVLCCVLVLAFALVLTGCGGGSKPIAVTVSPTTPQSMMAGQTVSFTASVAHDSKNAGVSWSLNGPGSLGGQTTTSVTYTAPSPISANGTATVTAKSVSDSTKTATATINLQAVSITLAPSAAQTLDQTQTLAVTATVSGDPDNKGVAWSLSGAGTIGVAPASPQTATYTAPATVTTASSATITATSVFDGTKTQTLTINLVTPPSITTTSLAAGQVGVAYSASLAASNGIAPYTWSIVSGAPPAGLSLSGSKISGTPTASGTFNFTVQVKDAGSVTATEPLSITMAAGVLSFSPASGSLPPATVGQAYSQTITVSGGLPPYPTGSTGGLPGWLNASAATGNNYQTVILTGTPGAGDIGTVNGITLTVQDSESPAVTGSATYSLTVNAASSATCNTMGSESMLTGQYAFVLTGFDNGTGSGETQPEPSLVGGVLTFNGSGTISAGTLDMNLNSGVQTNLALTSGSYGVGADQRGCMVITTSAGTQNYRFSLGNLNGGVASTAHVVDFDTTGPFVVGTMRQQSTSAFGTGSGQITGNYAFGVSSPQNSALCVSGITPAVCGGKFGAVGVFNMSSGTITGGEFDFNFDGYSDGQSTTNATWPNSAVPINTGGTYTVNGTTGRGTFTFTPNASGATAVNGLMYVVSSTEVLAMSADSQTNINGNNIWAGEIMQQSGTLSGNPLSGMYVGYDSGLGSSSGRTDMLLLGPFTSGTSGFPFTQLRDDSGTFSVQTVSAASAAYGVDSTGRTTVTSAGSNHLPILYLVSTSAAFFLNSNGGVDSGCIQSQTSTSSPAGSYAFGTINPQIAGNGETTGLVAFASSDINVTQDENSNGSLSVDSTQSLTYSTDSTGLGTIPVPPATSCTVLASSTTCQTVFYIISPTKAVVMDTTSGNPKLTIADK